MKINIGEYVRTKTGHIYKITSQLTIDMLMFIKEIEPIVKHSKNIIDIIEVGDYVNGEKVVEIDKTTNFVHTDFDKYLLHSIADYEIETILTHEQYEENCYKVGDIECLEKQQV